jgi:hypothetical protein
MSFKDPAGAVNGLVATDCDLWLSYFHQKRWMEEEVDEKGETIGATEKSEMTLVFQKHRSKASRINNEPDSLLENVTLSVQNLDLVKMVLSGKTPGNILYEYAITQQKFSTCVPDIS